MDVFPILQIAVGPVILISGVGLLLLSLTNRYGRVIDRARFLGDGLRRNGGSDNSHVHEQIAILRERARLLRTSIAFATISVLCTAVLIIGIFVGSLVNISPSSFIVVMFCGCLISLIGSLVCFLRDINRSLAALDLDLSGIM
jgi:Protein of unknown function (DUF2721)